MRIADGLEVFELTRHDTERPSIIYPTLVWDDETVVLVDTGFLGQYEIIIEAMGQTGISLDRINKIILTHHDLDHIGNAALILMNSCNRIEVLAHPEEVPYIQGEKKSLKMTPERIARFNRQISSLPEEEQKRMESLLKSVHFKVDTTLADGEELPFCGGISIIRTPGHTPGHICLYLKKYKTLVAGDALNVTDGQLVGPNPYYTYDLKEATYSLRKLSRHDIQTVICYHGGVYTGNPNRRIADLAGNMQ